MNNKKKVSEARNARTKNVLILQGNYGYGWDDLCQYEDTTEGRRERKVDYQTYIENEPNARFRTIERRVANPNYVASNAEVESLKLRIKPVRSPVQENLDESVDKTVYDDILVDVLTPYLDGDNDTLKLMNSPFSAYNPNRGIVRVGNHLLDRVAYNYAKNHGYGATYLNLIGNYFSVDKPLEISVKDFRTRSMPRFENIASQLRASDKKVLNRLANELDRVMRDIANEIIDEIKNNKDISESKIRTNEKLYVDSFDDAKCIGYGFLIRNMNTAYLNLYWYRSEDLAKQNLTIAELMSDEDNYDYDSFEDDMDTIINTADGAVEEIDWRHDIDYFNKDGREVCAYNTYTFDDDEYVELIDGENWVDLYF